MSPQRRQQDSGAQGPDAAASVDELGYEQARDELIEVVATLERGGLDLDTSLALWERGEALADRCEAHLAGARERIESVLNDEDANAADEDENDQD